MLYLFLGFIIGVTVGIIGIKWYEDKYAKLDINQAIKKIKKGR